MKIALDSMQEDPSGLYWSLWWYLSPLRLYNLLRFLWVLVNNLYVIPAYFAWLTLFSPLLLVSPTRFWQLEDVFFGWLLSMVACWNYTAGYDVIESGDQLDKASQENILFMPNHQSTADVPLCMTLFTARKHFADRVMWIMDRVFKYSNFGCVSWMHDDFFILAVIPNPKYQLISVSKDLYYRARIIAIPRWRTYEDTYTMFLSENGGNTSFCFRKAVSYGNGNPLVTGN